MLANAIEKNSKNKSATAFKTISEVAEILDVPQHVLRFWESKFSQVKPMKLKGSRRYYRPEDIDTLQKVKFLLYSQGYTIKGAKTALDKKMQVELPVVEAPKASVKAELFDLPVARAESLAKAAAAAAQPVGFSDEKKKELDSLIQELCDIRDQLKSCA